MENKKKKIEMILNIVKISEIGRCYLDITDENEGLRHIIYEGLKLDDYQLKWFDEAINEIFDNINPDYFTDKDIEEYEFNIEADPYTDQLTEWLHSDTERVYYLTEAMETYEPEDGFQLLIDAQCLEIDEVYNSSRRILIDWLNS